MIFRILSVDELIMELSKGLLAGCVILGRSSLPTKGLATSVEGLRSVESRESPFRSVPSSDSLKGLRKYGAGKTMTKSYLKACRT